MESSFISVNQPSFYYHGEDDFTVYLEGEVRSFLHQLTGKEADLQMLKDMFAEPLDYRVTTHHELFFNSKVEIQVDSWSHQAEFMKLQGIGAGYTHVCKGEFITFERPYSYLHGEDDFTMYLEGAVRSFLHQLTGKEADLQTLNDMFAEPLVNRGMGFYEVFFNSQVKIEVSYDTHRVMFMKFKGIGGAFTQDFGGDQLLVDLSRQIQF